MIEHFREYLDCRMAKARWTSRSITPRRMRKLEQWTQDFSSSYGVFVRVLVDTGTGNIAVQIEERDVQQA